MNQSLKIVGFLFLVGVCFAFARPTDNASIISDAETPALRQASLKAKALVVLKNKCNVCHLKKNKSVIFNETNMVKKSKKIYKMVFIKKKMPKDDVTLTTSERKDLQLWLDSLNP